MATNRKYAQLQPFTLYGSGANIGDTTLVISVFKTIDGVNLAMTDFGTKGYGTIEPNVGTQEEQFSFTGVTQNANGTATLSGVSTVLFTYPYTETSGLAKSHAGGVNMDISNTSGFYNTFANKFNDETINNLYTFPDTEGARPRGSSDTDTAVLAAYVTFGQLGRTSFAGTVNASTVQKGISQIATGAQLAAGTNVGSTGAIVVASGGSFTNTSSGAGDVNKVPVLGSNGEIAQGFLNTARTIGAVYSFTADNCQITTDADSANDAVRSSYLNSKMFGTGADGAFAQSSGTTTLNTAGKYVYQYSSFALTGTAVLTTGANLVNKTLIILVQGDLTITSATVPAVDLRNQGGAKGAKGVHGASGTAGSAGTAGATRMLQTASAGGSGDNVGSKGGGGGGGAGGLGNAGVAGNAPAAGTILGGAAGAAEIYDSSMTIDRLLALTHIGGGGSGGGGGANGAGTGGDGGDGGNGAGSIIFIVGGNINLTSTFNASGANGSVGSDGSGGGSSGGSGGGGAGGFIGVFYGGTVTANTATFTVTGGTGGVASGGAFTGGAGGNGGAGQSVVRAISSWLPV